ncbi:hypothetical protein N7493_005450 [Penicillium malachiteum]|uniref:Wax synthase domain-containing protein n=1 Tax=Penicillium malachiteum TaxID=1324776 RepID=A0AAD6HMP5_9EURO|nr:hypothetical protein N7493_005450 [Penicillium malachiteum]
MDPKNTSFGSNILLISGLYGIHCLIPAILLILTAKTSILRYLFIPCLAIIAYQSIGVAKALGPGFIWCELARLFVTVFFQALNLLLLNAKDNSDIPLGTGSSFIARVYYAIGLFTQPRGINTPWQVKNTPPHPAYYTRRNFKEPPRSRFVIRQLAIAAWQYLALDVFSALALQQALEQREKDPLPPTVQWDLSTEQWIERIISNLVAGFIVSRMLIDFYHRAFSVIIVGTGLDSPGNCPPLFGRAADAGSLRGFWGKFWHQLVRQPFGSVSTFITRDILGLKSTIEQYTSVLLVFFFSGGLHVVLDIVQEIPGEESGAMLLFMTAGLGLMIEDGIKDLWRKISASRKAGESRKDTPFPLWQKVVGFMWAMGWLGVTSTWYFYPQMVRPENQNLVPFSLASQAGLPVVGAAVLIWGLLVALVFEVEI